MKWTCPKLWDGGVAYIIGGGTSVPRQFGVPEDIIKQVMNNGHPSLYTPYLAPLHDKHVIGVNNVYRMGSWMDALFFGDCAWYNVYRTELALWPNLKVTCCDRFANKPEALCENIKFLARDRSRSMGITEDPSKVSWNNNSGAAAINLAYHLGVKVVVLLGFDMTLDKNRVSHWHGCHVKYRANKRYSPPFERHMKSFPFIAADAKRLGLTILNASPISVLDMFQKITLAEALEMSHGAEDTHTTDQPDVRPIWPVETTVQ